MIQVENVSKRFGDLTAVDGVSFEARPGEIFGLLGPNGAGKTTTINMICGVLRPDGGRVLVDGRDIWSEPTAVKRSLGVVPQEIAVYEDLTARDNLAFWGSLYGLRGHTLDERIRDVLTRVGLADRADDKPQAFSGGMKRRLNLCMGLLHRPSVLLLDEPTVGIDPQARLNILDVVKDVAERGTTVLYTTHYLDEAEQLCDRLAIVDHGTVLAAGTLTSLRQLAGEGETLRLTGGFTAADARTALPKIDGIDVLHTDEGTAILAIQDDGPGLTAVLPRLLDGALAVDDVSIQKPSLQNVFLRLTGRELRD